MTNKGRIKLYFDNWNPYHELENRILLAQNKVLESLSKINLKPIPIQK